MHQVWRYRTGHGGGGGLGGLIGSMSWGHPQNDLS